MEALGANGPGLLAVTGIPNVSNLRSYLLPLARKLSLLDRQTRNRILK
ncbi:2-oxoglutarate and Fe(II)-dependent oxygenase superfamily protein, partial [Trifolium medium]|nr:2-oxoglutarate and Fe(II)-dependent oxygenase superfamily protein [Trifolium medium]